MRFINFRLLFICVAILLISSCNYVEREGSIPININTSEKATNKIDADFGNEYQDTLTDIHKVTTHNDVSQTPDEQINISQKDVQKSYLGLDGSPLVIPTENEWKSVNVFENSNEEFDSNAISGIYNNGVTYFLNGESYVRFPTGYEHCVLNEKTSDINSLELGQFETMWEKVSVGDIIGTLKVEKAYATYSYFEQLDAFLWTDIEVLFSGETVLDGYLIKYPPDDFMYPNEIHFIPDINSLLENDFPMLCNSRTKEGFMRCYTLYLKDDCFICGDTTEISINSLSNSVFEELSEILNDESICKTSVTLSNIKLRAWVEDVDNNRYCSADLISWDIIGGSN